MTKEFDMRLAVLNSIRKRGECLNQRDIARVCGCSRSLVHQIEQRALRKIRTRIRMEMGMSFDEWFKLGSQNL
jgi:transcriptional regulator